MSDPPYGLTPLHCKLYSSPKSRTHVVRSLNHLFPLLNIFPFIHRSSRFNKHCQFRPFLFQMKLSKEELRVLPVTVCARFCQTLILAYHTMSLESCSDYITLHMKKVWPHLRHLWYRPLELTLDLWKRVVESRGIEFP